jgi:hypothetical protein
LGTAGSGVTPLRESRKSVGIPGAPCQVGRGLSVKKTEVCNMLYSCRLEGMGLLTPQIYHDWERRESQNGPQYGSRLVRRRAEPYYHRHAR